MSQFESVTVKRAANLYFDGKVSSRTLTFSDGTTKTLGVMLPGEYEFDTGKPELVELTCGRLDAFLPGHDSPQCVQQGESFHVPGNSRFRVVVHEVTDYVCSFLDESPS